MRGWRSGPLPFISALLTFPLIAFAQTSSSPDPATLVGLSADSVGVHIAAAYSSCPNTPVTADVWLVNTSGNSFQNRCTLAGGNWGLCLFKRPLPAGTPGSNILVRLWSVNQDCTTLAPPPNFKDSFISSNVTASQYYSAYTENRLINIDKLTYQAKLDRNTGTTYEFYSKRAVGTSAQDTMPHNALNENMGAALQIAFQDQDEAAANAAGRAAGTVNSCDVHQGYWNPTQAGAFCTFVDSYTSMIPITPTGLNAPAITCDGVQNQLCGSAQNKVDFGDMTMMNWDYGPNYVGPWNPADTLHLMQSVSAADNYIAYDLTLENKGGGAKQRNGFIELPTFYFTNNYRRYFTPDPSGVIKTEIPIVSHMNSGYDSGFVQTDLHWVTFENSAGPTNDAITVAWFYNPTLLADTRASSYAVQQSAIDGVIKFANLHTVTLNPSLPENPHVYHAKYVVFPYRYDDVITTSFGTKSVRDTIAAMQAEYDAKWQPPATPALPLDRLVDPVASIKFTMNQQVTPTATVHVRQTAAGTILGTQPAGAVATVVGGPVAAALDGTSLVWWNLTFSSGVSGWVGEDILAAYTAPPAPTVSISASPTLVNAGGSSSLTWSSTNATSCSGNSFTASGTSGSVTVSPTVTTIYTITCTGAGGSKSASVTVTFVADTAAPSVPTSLSATTISSSQINLTWTASTDNVGVKGYKVFRDGVQIGTTASASYSSTGLTASTVYNYAVTAYDAGGNTSARSASIGAITMGASASSVAVGSRMIATANLNVRASASPSAAKLGTESFGALGTVIGGPRTASGHTWWQANFDNGISGWCVGDYLVAAAASTSPSVGFAPDRSTQVASATAVSDQLTALQSQIAILMAQLQALLAR